MNYLKLFRLQSPIGIVTSKMFAISALWEGIRPYLLKLILLIFNKPSLVPVRAKNIFALITFLRHLQRHHGDTLAVKWLKANFVCLQRYIGNDKISSLRSIDKDLPMPRLINGLPFIIPQNDRSLIRRGSPQVVQFWLSVFSLYRVTLCEPSLKLGSITDPYTGDEAIMSKLRDELRHSPFTHFFKFLPGFANWKDKVNLYPSKVTMISTASPSSSTSWHGILTDLILLRKTGICYLFDDYLNLVGNSYMFKIIQEAMDIVENGYSRLVNKTKPGTIPEGQDFLPSAKSTVFHQWPRGKYFVGQLQFKEEAAGKLRVFAMVDWWTQNALRPLHNELFNLLKLIPNDGTFDQDSSVSRCIQKASEAGCAFSFDLSSATDRLPVILQADLIDKLFPIKIGEAWRKLLTDREYYISQGEASYQEEFRVIKYAVGQPMGALSSWAMLAIFHHWLLQYCNFQLGKSRTWYDRYEILGDDLVIFEKDVADYYLLLMKQIGVEINLSKSIVSPDRASLEFAKRTVMDSQNVSAISIKQLIAETSMAGRLGNILYYGRLGLIRNVTTLKALLSRYGKFKSLSDLNFPLISLLGSLFKSKEITLNDILRALIDPSNEEEDLLEREVKLPVQSLLVELLPILRREQKRPFLLPNWDARSELAEENESYLADMIVLKALGVAKEVELKFESWKALNRNRLFGSWSSYDDSDVYCSEWLFELIDNFHSFDPTDLVDEIETIAIKQAKIHHLSIDEALSLLDRVDSIKRKWSFGKPVKRVEKVMKEGTSPIFHFLVDQGGYSNLSYLANRPYYR